MKTLYVTITPALAALPVGLRTCILHMLTGKDNETFDVSRLLLLLAGVAYVVLVIYHAVAHAVFNPTDFGEGAGFSLGGGAAGIAVKHKTEPGGQ